MRPSVKIIGLLLILTACAGGKASGRGARRDKLGPRPEDVAPPPSPVTLSLIRVTSSNKEIEARHNVLLISDTVLRMRIVNHSGESLYLKIAQTPNNEGLLPLDAPAPNPSLSDKDNGLYKISSDENVEVDFPIHHGLRDAHLTASLMGDPEGEKSYARAQVTMRPRSVLEFYGDDELPVKTNAGVPQFEIDRSNASRQKTFFVEMVPGPSDGATCTIAVESVSEDGTLLSQVLANLGAPGYRDGPFHAIDGDQVLPNIQRYRRHNLAEGDPADSPTSPAPRDRSDLIATGEIRVRRIVCR